MRDLVQGGLATVWPSLYNTIRLLSNDVIQPR